MKITIENYKNIKTMQLQLEANKLNFIYGISGSGKSAIAESFFLNNETLQKNITYGSNELVNIQKSTDEEFQIFNEVESKKYLFEKNKEGVYEIIYKSNEELDLLLENLQINISNSPKIINLKEKCNEYITEFERIVNDLKFKFTKDGDLKKTGNYAKELNNNGEYNITTESQEKISWMKKAPTYDNFLDRSILSCPFCSQDITEDIFQDILVMMNSVPQLLLDIQTKFRESNILDSDKSNFDVKTPSGRTYIKEKTEKAYLVYEECKHINEFLNIKIKNFNDINEIKRFEISTESILYFKNHNIDINESLEGIFVGKDQFIALKKTYNAKLNSQIEKNIRGINKVLRKVSDEYMISVNDNMASDQDYIISHLNYNKDCVENLSSGEKNLISLVLFLVSTSNENVIIDDPASSFDEYKREQLLDFIHEIRYKQNTPNKTTLLLSHDQIFLKFFAFKMKNSRNNDYIGKVLFLENFSNIPKLQNINPDDIKNISDLIKDRCQEVNSYELKIVNARSYFEINRANNEHIYNYLSAILHIFHDNENQFEIVKGSINAFIYNKTIKEFDKRDVIKHSDVTKIIDFSSDEHVQNLVEQIFDDELKEKFYENKSEFSENKILDDMSQKGIILPSFNGIMIENVIDEITSFEKMIIVRELLNTNEKEYKSELNSVVHFNYSLVHTLDPYKFNFQSKLSNIITNKKWEEI